MTTGELLAVVATAGFGLGFGIVAPPCILFYVMWRDWKRGA